MRIPPLEPMTDPDPGILVVGSFVVEDHLTTTSIVLTANDFNKVHLFSNTASCLITLPSVSADDIGKWVEIRKKDSDNITIQVADVGDTIIDTGTMVISTNATPLFDHILLFVKSATHFSVRNRRFSFARMERISLDYN